MHGALWCAHNVCRDAAGAWSDTKGSIYHAHRGDGRSNVPGWGDEKSKSKNEYEVIELLDDIGRDIKNYDLEHRIQELELKFSKDPSEATFNELKSEKNKQNIN